MRLVFMGTPMFAVPSLKALVEAGHEVLGVFTQPDKPKNRGMKLLPTPVKEYALTHNIPVYQPDKLKDGQTLDTLRQMKPEMIVVAAYGRILPVEILELPPLGSVNVHSSHQLGHSQWRERNWRYHYVYGPRAGYRGYHLAGINSHREPGGCNCPLCPAC